MLWLLDLYQKFGFRFDHIYAYEYTQQSPDKVFQAIPRDYEAAYHWINVGVESNEKSRRNPLQLLLENYDEGDLVVVKLDIDTPKIERVLAEQLRTDPRLAKLIDHFYFEHHVSQKEMKGYWGKEPLEESIGDSLQLFSELRQRGIPSHFWV